MAISESVRITRKYRYQGEEIEAAEDVTGGSLVTISETAPALSTDFAIAVAKIDQSAMKMFFLKVSAAATIKTYLVAQIDKTFTLAAGQVIQWTVSDPAAMCPIAADFDSIKVTCTPLCDVQLRVLQDPTPPA